MTELPYIYNTFHNKEMGRWVPFIFLCSSFLINKREREILAGNQGTKRRDKRERRGDRHWFAGSRLRTNTTTTHKPPLLFFPSLSTFIKTGRPGKHRGEKRKKERDRVRIWRVVGLLVNLLLPSPSPFLFISSRASKRRWEGGNDVAFRQSIRKGAGGYMDGPSDGPVSSI